ncbi:MAG: response regulator transcription factor [Roseburia sp.]|nr:response regulator transcription factor [Roseburia sp.]
MHYNCLIIDDETDLAQMTCEYFQMFGVSCACEESAKGGMAFLEQNDVDILLLDINLSQGSGFELCRKIRERWEIPILFISARQSDDDVLIALNIGGDDYIKKPYSLSVLLAKVRVVLNRMEKRQNQRNILPEEVKDQEDFYLCEEKLCVYVKGREVSLKAKEFALLKCLYEHQDTIVTKEKIFDTVWGDNFYSDGTLNVQIRKLREKLEETPNEPKLIKTVWGTGYMLKL